MNNTLTEQNKGLQVHDVEISKLAIKSVATAILQIPTTENSNTAIAQTTFETENVKVSMPGFATQTTSSSKETSVIISDAIESSIRSALSAIKTIARPSQQQAHKELPVAPAKHSSSGAKPITESQSKFIKGLARGTSPDTVARETVGKPLSDCSSADADTIIKTLKAKRTPPNTNFPWQTD